MRKTDKKIDNSIRKALTETCDIALQQIGGFEWLTHTVNYDHFPESLTVTCVFQTNDELERARSAGDDVRMRDLVKQHLLEVDIHLKNIRQQVRFDTEQACTDENAGNWKQRLG